MKSSSTNTNTQLTNNSELQQCAKVCLECYQMCASTMVHCLAKGEEHAELSHVRLLEDCAKICSTSADFLIRESDFHMHTCKACAAICEKCAQSCQSMKNDAQMNTCAEICMQCAESCNTMSQNIN